MSNLPYNQESKLPFHDSTPTISKCFEIVHVGTWGPYKPKAYDGFSQFLTIDDFKRNTQTFIVKNKSDAVVVIQNYSVMVKAQYKFKILCLEDK